MLVTLCISVVLLACREPAQKKPASHVPAEVLIKFKPDVPEDSIKAYTAKLGLEKVREISAINVRVYRITSQRSVEQVVRDCQSSPHVEYAEPNIKYRIPEKNQGGTE
jgi:hypothetical protein